MKTRFYTEPIGAITFAFTFLLILLAIPAPYANAQVLYGFVVGNITDASGAVVPGADVKITKLETNDTREATSNNGGAYIVGNLSAGTYTVVISKSGFHSFSKQNIQVAFNSEVRVNATLEVGSLEQTVTVSAENTELQTDRADVHTDLSRA